MPEVAQATLYRHVNKLEEGGMLEVVQTKQIRGVTEKVYKLVESAISLSSSDLEKATKEDHDHIRYFTMFLSSLLGKFAGYIDHGDIDLQKDGVGYRQLSFYANDEEFQQLHKKRFDRFL